MSKMKRRICLGLILVLLCGCAVRVCFVNKDLDVSVMKIYQKGQAVPYERDYTDNSEECIDGYTATVLDYEIVPIEKVYERCGVEAQEIGDAFHKFYVLVDVSFANVDNTSKGATGVNLFYASLVCKNDYIVLDSEVFQLLNPNMPGTGFWINPGTDKKVTLAYAVNSSNFKDEESIEKADFVLQITDYPTRKLLKLK